MEFIHKSTLKFHGNLKPSTCLVDSRLQIKLSGFGLWEFRHGDKMNGNGQEVLDYEGELTPPKIKSAFMSNMI